MLLIAAGRIFRLQQSRCRFASSSQDADRAVYDRVPTRKVLCVKTGFLFAALLCTAATATAQQIPSAGGQLQQIPALPDQRPAIPGIRVERPGAAVAPTV